MDNQFAIMDKSMLHNEEKYLEFMDLFVKDTGPIEEIYQRKARYHPDKVILEIKMAKEEAAV